MFAPFAGAPFRQGYLRATEPCRLSDLKPIMNVTESIQMARKTHELLRSRVAGTPPDEQSAAAYRALKTALDELWAAAQPHPDMKQIRGAIGMLTIDAEYFAGLNDGEGFRDAAEAWQQYSYLEHTLGSVKAP